MGLFDGLLGGVVGAGMVSVLNGVIEQHGGVQGIVSQFEKQGLGETVKSWVGTGPNLPISADQLQSVLGSDTVTHIAQQLGLNSGDVAGKLAQMLPQVINQLTPNGQAPAGGLGDIGSLLGSLMKS